MVDADVSVGEAYAVGPIDLLLLFSFVGLLIYWYMKKKSTLKPPEITGLSGLKQINTLSNGAATDSSGFLAKMKKSGR